MLYKKNYKQVLSRLKELYSGNGKDKIYAVMDIPNRALQNYADETKCGETVYPDLENRIRFWDSYSLHFTDLEDDSIPSSYLTEFDEGLYGGLMGGEVRFLNSPDTGWISSMTVPFWKDLSYATALALPKTGDFWYDRMLSQMKLFADACKGKYGCSHFICINAMNLMFELRGGTNSYYDLIEEPEAVLKVFDFAIDLNRMVQDAYFDNVGLFEGGTVSNLLQWIPGRVISESVDPYHLTGRDMFEQAGKEHIERLISHYDGAVVHLHANAYSRLLPYVSELKKLKAVALLDDPYNPRAIDQLETLQQRSSDIPLVFVTITYCELLDMLKSNTLPGNVLYKVTEVPSVDAANKAMEAVRAYTI